jgi:hypothetical protein
MPENSKDKKKPIVNELKDGPKPKDIKAAKKLAKEVSPVLYELLEAKPKNAT